MDDMKRLVELVAELLVTSQRTDLRLGKMDDRFQQMDDRFQKMDERFERIEGNLAELNYYAKEVSKDVNGLLKQQMRTNVQLSEHTLAIMKLADRITQVVDHEKRIGHIEQHLFHT